jgi:hypothetical protein
MKALGCVIFGIYAVLVVLIAIGVTLVWWLALEEIAGWADRWAQSGASTPLVAGFER